MRVKLEDWHDMFIHFQIKHKMMLKIKYRMERSSTSETDQMMNEKDAGKKRERERDEENLLR